MPAFLTPFVMRLIALGAAFLAFGGFCAYRMHQHDQIALNALQSEFDAFKGGVKALGDAAQKRADAENLANAKRKADADKENAAAHAVDARAIASLRLAADRARGRQLPAAPSGSSRPDLLCLDRAEYQRADGEATERLRQGARGLADEGTAATVDLNTAKAWAKK